MIVEEAKHAVRANKLDQQYLDLMADTLFAGTMKKDRTGTGTVSLFGKHIEHDMQEGFPLLTSKTVYTKGVIVELLWFLGKHMEDPKYVKFGRTNIRYLLDNDCNIWVGDAYKAYLNACIGSDSDGMDKSEFINAIQNSDSFAIMWGNLGAIYGYQWREWNGEIDQIEQLIHDLKHDPDSRRLMVTAWNPTDLPDSVLPPCHYSFQCYTRPISYATRRNILEHVVQKPYVIGTDSLVPIMDKNHIPERSLSLSWNQRSVDVPLGLPFNIASYGLLLHMIAKVVNMVPYKLVGNLGDTHIYLNQTSGVLEQLNSETFDLPQLVIKEGVYEKLTDFEIDSFSFVNYNNAGKINYPLSN